MSVAFEPRMTAVQFELCKVQAELFESACAKNYDMSAFIPAFMSSEIAEGLDARFNHYQWAGVPYLLNAMGDVCGVVPAKHPPMRDSAEACYWTGYTYRFWNFKTGEASRDIYRIADYRTMDRAYAGYHTLSCDMAVDRLKDDFSEANNNETNKGKGKQMKTKLKSILAIALCAVGLSAFAAEPEAVQLWENGPYFATCNVGATAPQDSGIYTNFNGAAQAVTDVMGAGWRAPTAEEFTNLLNNCDHSWSNNYDNTGIEGLMFTSKSDSSKSIFLPAVSAGAGRYWTSSEKDSVYAWYLYFDEGEISIGANPRVAGAINVRAVRDTPPPEISAVSAEGFLDLTVGDRVAADTETLVVDPAWGEAKTATVKIDGESSARTYMCASNDLWQTAALTPGRYAMAFTSGETNETAAFWKTGAGWEVLDNSQYNEGIEFQAGTTYLVLNAATVPDDKTLKVVDGAKFEYGEGAGFIGGQLEMPRRYRKEVVEGDLYRIVEKIKGCADNPWDVGVGVEAYTNGTELVIVGTGTITDLSGIPAGVKGGIRAITVTEATVKGADENAFADFNTIALTLPDGWQGELPEKGVWYGATGVELTTWPMAVKNLKVQQCYPWNGLVDVKFALSGEGNVKVVLSVTADGKLLANPTVTGVKKFDLGTGGELKDLKLTWDAKADFGDEALHQKIKVKLMVEKVD